MRVAWVLALTLAISSVASATQHHKAAPKYSDKSGKSKVTAPAQLPKERNTTSLQLKRLEQQNTKLAGAGRKTAGKQHIAPFKMQHERSNPPIRVAATSVASEKGKNRQASNSYKGRLRGRH